MDSGLPSKWVVQTFQEPPRDIIGDRELRKRESPQDPTFVIYCDQKEEAEDLHDTLVFKGFSGVVFYEVLKLPAFDTSF